jgi:hypothetical protein
MWNGRFEPALLLAWRKWREKWQRTKQMGCANVFFIKERKTTIEHIVEENTQ